MFALHTGAESVEPCCGMDELMSSGTPVFPSKLLLTSLIKQLYLLIGTSAAEALRTRSFVQPVQVAPVGETLLRQSGKLDRARPQRHQAHSDRLQSAR